MKVDRHESKRKTGESACQELQAEKELKKGEGGICRRAILLHFHLLW